MSRQTKAQIVVLIVLCVLLAVLFKFFPDMNRKVASVPESNTPVVQKINQKTLSPLDNVIVVRTDADRELGLGKRESLPERAGMLFVFETPDHQAFWMKDMHFPLDIIWLDENLVITHVEQNISPESYPKIFQSETLSKYVLEVNAGFSSKNSLSEGQNLNFLENYLNIQPI